MQRYGVQVVTLVLKYRKTWVPYVITATAYLAAYVVLDRISFLHPFSEVGITPWDPSQGLTMAILLRVGLCYAPAVPLAMLLSELTVRHVMITGPAMIPIVISVIITAGGYICAGYVLLMMSRFDPYLYRLHDVVALMLVGLVSTFLVACAVVGNFVVFDLVSSHDYWLATLRSWLGDFVGILTITPALLVLTCDRPWARFGEHKRNLALPLMEIAAQLMAIGGAVWLVFGLEFPDELKLFYLLFLPTIWVA
ncbi:MAG: MASE1 domain-containing protein, partial [Rhodospirillaceae bacterium]